MSEGEARGIFAYGTLQFPEVLLRVTGLRFEGRPARLADHRCVRFRDREYPGVVAEPGAVTPGVYYPDVGEASIAALDRFEGSEYERVGLRVELTDGSEPACIAWAYRVRESEHGRLDPTDWSKTEFERVGLARFLSRLQP